MERAPARSRHPGAKLEGRPVVLAGTERNENGPVLARRAVERALHEKRDVAEDVAEERSQRVVDCAVAQDLRRPRS